MLIPNDEKKLYVDFALQLVKELRSIIPGDKIVWHYTKGSSLISILDSMSIFSTQLSCLNDTTELRYGARLFQEALATLRLDVKDDTALKLVDDAIAYFKENPDFPAQAVDSRFVTCFSEEKDDLSQWRAYGGGENGYAIGFKVVDLWGCPNSHVVRVNYDITFHRALAQRAAEAMVQFFLDGLKKYAPSAPTKFGEEFLQSWETAIGNVAPLVKDPAFKNERECRIVKGFGGDDFQSLKFFQKNNIMSRHLPLQPPLRTPTDPYRLAIAEVMVGPCRHPQISRTSVDTLLRQKGYPTGMVTISQIPFQIT